MRSYVATQHPCPITTEQWLGRGLHSSPACRVRERGCSSLSCRECQERCWAEAANSATIPRYTVSWRSMELPEHSWSLIFLRYQPSRIQGPLEWRLYITNVTYRKKQPSGLTLRRVSIETVFTNPTCNEYLYPESSCNLVVHDGFGVGEGKFDSWSLRSQTPATGVTLTTPFAAQHRTQPHTYGLLSH